MATAELDAAGGGKDWVVTCDVTGRDDDPKLDFGPEIEELSSGLVYAAGVGPSAVTGRARSPRPSAR